MNPFSLFLRRCAILLFLFALMGNSALAASDPFPGFQCIQPNVAFWKKVYAEYPSSKGLIHDSQNLAIIYEVITLESDDTPGSSQTNECLLRSVKEKYRQILSGLAQGRPPSNPEEKRVAELFGPAPKAETLKAAAENIRFQRCLSDRFQAGLVRSGRYFEQIKDIFSQYGLPSDLAYLPHVESSYDYQAYSKSGAAGIWQLIRDTGSRFLTISSALDERRDPIIASHAAAKFLQGNYTKLESWPLALTAYNHGLTSVLRAKNSLMTFEKIYQEYDGPHFGFASKNFYAEFLAAREIAKNYRQHFKDLRLDEPVQARVFSMNTASGIKAVSSHFNVNIATLAELNPALLKPVWDGRLSVPKGYSLRLPKTAAAAEVLPPIPPSSPPASPPPAGQKSSRTHGVKQGDTLVAIAEHYGVSTRDLIALNQLGHDAVLKVGQKLQIPLPEDKRSPTKAKTRVAKKNAAGK